MMNISKQALLIVPGVSVGLIAWAQFSDGQTKFRAQRHQAISRPAPSASGPVQFGDPLPGLTTDQLAAFGAGLEHFQEEDTPESGLGPIFNNVSSLVQDVASGQQRVGRFGWKAQQATLLAFAGDAYLNEVGITSRLFPRENAPNGDTNLLAFFDVIADPEDEVDPATGKADIDAFADFIRFLAPPPQLALTFSASSGQTLFGQIGCATCHTPVMQTGDNSVAALDRKPVPLFSDLLLHDMGALGDGIEQGTAGTREMRTAPLWGLRASAPYLHDGRAATVDAAVRAHDGEAKAARDRYLRLDVTENEQLLEFLNSI